MMFDNRWVYFDENLLEDGAWVLVLPIDKNKWRLLGDNISDGDWYYTLEESINRYELYEWGDDDLIDTVEETELEEIEDFLEGEINIQIADDFVWFWVKINITHVLNILNQ